MEDTIWHYLWDSYDLTFSGIKLTSVTDEESDEQVEFEQSSFIDNDGDRVDITIEETKPSPYAKPSESQYAYVYIGTQGIHIKTLKILGTPNGKLYLDT